MLIINVVKIYSTPALTVLSEGLSIDFQFATIKLAIINMPPAINCQVIFSCKKMTPNKIPPRGNIYVTIVERVGPIS